jgi:zinc and cadmium transporter
MTLETLLALYCLVIVLASTAGGHLPSLIRMTHLRTQLLISFVGGLMLGISLLHLLPHAVVSLGSASSAGVACLLGIVAMFLLLRAFQPPHAHGFVDATPRVFEEGEEGEGSGEETRLGSGSGGMRAEHGMDHGHGHGHGHESCGHSGAGHDRGMGWLGILIGLWLHTMIDGVALAASAVADAQHAGIAMAGLGTFLAIALHKPLDAFAITSTMRTSGWPPLHQAIINVVFAIACPVGALLFYFGVTRLTDSSMLLGWGLAISAGFFICISLADLLPEVSFHQHDRGKLTLSLFLGIALAFAVENLPGHSHIHAVVQSPPAVESLPAVDR